MKIVGLLAAFLLTWCAQQDSKATVISTVSANAELHVDDGTADGSVQYDRRPQILTAVKPMYPMDAILGRIQGTVIVEILIDYDGDVARARVLKAVTPALDAAAVESLRRWRFVPAIRHGIPVQAVARVPVEFRVKRMGASSNEAMHQTGR